MSTNDLKTLKDLSKNPDAITNEPDKGQGIAIMNKSYYINKVEDILKDKTKFCQVLNKPDSIIIKNEDIFFFLRKFKKEDITNEFTYSSLFTFVSKPEISSN